METLFTGGISSSTLRDEELGIDSGGPIRKSDEDACEVVAFAEFSADRLRRN